MKNYEEFPKTAKEVKVDLKERLLFVVTELLHQDTLLEVTEALMDHCSIKGLREILDDFDPER